VLSHFFSSTLKKILVLVWCTLFLSLDIHAFEFSLKVNQGWAWMSGGDLNKSISGWRQYYEDRQSSSFSSNYTLGELHSTFEVGAEVEVSLSSRWSIGLGATFLSFGQKGEVSTKLASQENYTLSPTRQGTISLEELTSQQPENEVLTVPVTLSIYYLLPLGGDYSIYLGGGGGLYLSRYRHKEAYTYSFNYTDTQLSADSSVLYVDKYASTGEYTETARTQDFGLHGVAGLDIRLSSSFSIAVEILGRWVNLEGWEGEKTDSYNWSHTWGVSGVYSENGQTEESYDGKIWRAEARSDQTGKTYPRLVFSGEKPVSADYTAVRPANISLSGFSARIGLRLRFGKSS
jgi:hypothetical protein